MGQVKFVELHVICLMFLVSPVLVKVYDVLPLLMCGQVRHLCLELQRNVPAGSLGELRVFVFRTNQRLGELGKATTVTSLSIFFKCSLD